MLSPETETGWAVWDLPDVLFHNSYYLILVECWKTITSYARLQWSSLISRTAQFEPYPERLQSLPRYIQELWGGQLLLQSPGLLLPLNMRLNTFEKLELRGTYFTVSLASTDHELSGDGFLMIFEKELKSDLGCRPTKLFPQVGWAAGT